METKDATSTSDKKWVYAPAVLSYLDVLGMEALLDEAGEDAAKVASVLNIFRYFSTPDVETQEVWKWSFINFSDLVVRVVPILTDENTKYRLGLVFHEVMDLCHIQANLLARNVLIRGALTIGFINVDDGLIFGPALAKAHLMEEKEAIYPRILVDPDVITLLESCPVLRAHDDFKEEMQYLESTIQNDADGKLFLNYLDWLNENADDNAQHVEFLVEHRRQIARRRMELDGSPLEPDIKLRRAEKIEWMHRLHNKHVKTLKPEVVREEGGLDRDDLLSSEVEK